MCGAVSGALMVLGLEYGHFNAENNEQKQRAYSLVSEFVSRFRKINNSIVCRDLHGLTLQFHIDKFRYNYVKGDLWKQ